MTTSSLPQIYSITSSSGVDTITLSDTIVPNGGYINTGTVTLNGTGGAGNIWTTSTGTSGPYYTINTGAGVGGAGNVTIGGSEWIWKSPEEFVDCFPEWARIEQMCKEYPGLKIAFEKFKTTYHLVKDHYDTPKDQRPRP